MNPPILFEGKLRTRYKILETEYVDRETGEILSAKQMCKLVDAPLIRFSERCMQRRAILDGLRPEVRKFAVYVLRHRNRRRGIAPGIGTLCKWYAKETGKQVCHVRRYVPQLHKCRLLEGESLLGTLFQISGADTSATDHLAEDTVAQLAHVLRLMSLKTCSLLHLPAQEHTQ